MKASIRILPLLAALALAAVPNAARAQGYKLADKVGASIAEFRDEIVQVKKESDAALAALDKIVAEATVDPRKAYKEFEKCVPKVDSAAAKARKRAEDMKKEGKTYFDKWEKDLAAVKDPDIRKLAEERKTQLQATFSNIKGFMEPARDQFAPWLSNLKDLQKYLGQDLSIGGIDAAKGQIGKARTEGRAVQETLEKVVGELNSIAATLTPAKAKKK